MEEAERPRDAALAGGLLPASVPGSGTAEPDGDRRHPGAAAGTASPVVRLAGVSCRRGRREALHRVDLEVQPARVTGVLRPIGVVLQETALYEELTVTENLRFTAALYSLDRPAQRITEVLELIDLADRANDVVTSLSGGMRRRVTLARALLHQPELLIIDEPTLGIDAEARHAIWEHIRLLRATGTTVIVASNYLDEVQALCDIAAVLREGQLVAYEAPESLVAQAGQCLDLDCAAESVPEITGLVLGLPGVSRAEMSPSGLTAFLRGDADPDAIVREVLQQVHISGFRVRAADLAEVFRALDPAGKGTAGE